MVSLCYTTYRLLFPLLRLFFLLFIPFNPYSFRHDQDKNGDSYANIMGDTLLNNLLSNVYVRNESLISNESQKNVGNDTSQPKENGDLDPEIRYLVKKNLVSHVIQDLVQEKLKLYIDEKNIMKDDIFECLQLKLDLFMMFMEIVEFPPRLLEIAESLFAHFISNDNKVNFNSVDFNEKIKKISNTTAEEEVTEAMLIEPKKTGIPPAAENFRKIGSFSNSLVAIVSIGHQIAFLILTSLHLSNI
jgi:hypothetical protein